MQLECKKGVSMYILVLAIASFIIALILHAILGRLYVPELERCNLLNYEITKYCKTPEGMEVHIKNNGDSDIDFVFSEDKENVQKVFSRSLGRVSIKTSSSSVHLNPVILTFDGSLACGSREEKYKINSLEKC